MSRKPSKTKHIRNASPPSGYFELPVSLTRDNRLSWEEKGLLCDIISRAVSDGFSVEEFIEITGVDATYLKEKLEKFVSYGYIRLDIEEE